MIIIHYYDYGYDDCDQDYNLYYYYYYANNIGTRCTHAYEPAHAHEIRTRAVTHTHAQCVKHMTITILQTAIILILYRVIFS